EVSEAIEERRELIELRHAGPRRNGDASADSTIDQYFDYRLLSWSSSSMTRLNSSNGCAPLSVRPFMKNAGVPDTPASFPSLISASTAALYLRESTQPLKREASRPSLAAIAFRSSSSSFLGSPKRTS